MFRGFAFVSFEDEQALALALNKKKITLKGYNVENYGLI